MVDKINAAKKLGMKIILVDRIEACCGSNKFSSVDELLKCVERIDRDQ